MKLVPENLLFTAIMMVGTVPGILYMIMNALIPALEYVTRNPIKEELAAAATEVDVGRIIICLK